MYRVLRWFGREVDAIERSSAPAWYFFATFLSATTLRTFFELFSDAESGAGPYTHFFELLSGISTADVFPTFVHYTLFYSALALTLILVLHVLTRQDIRGIARLISAGFLILLIVPALDLILSGGAGYDLSYLSPELHGNLVYLFATFFGPLVEAGVSPGMRIEIALAVLGSFAYSIYRGSVLLRAMSVALAIYAVIFSYIAAPYFTNPLFSFVGAQAQYSNLAGIRFFGLLAILQLLVFFYMLSRPLVRTYLRDLRYFRLAHYSAMFFFGALACFAAAGGLHFTTETATIVPLMLLSLAGAWGFSVATNNVVDLDIDRISNPERPLVKGGVSAAEYRVGMFVLLALALFAGALSGVVGLICISAFIAAYFLYSMPPLRLKRVPYFSKLAIVINSSLLFFAGFALFNILSPAAIADFFFSLAESIPNPLLFILPPVVLLAANFIDLKDYDGDKAAGIRTLPVLFGMRAAQALIGSAFLFLYVSLGSLLVSGMLFYAAVATGLVQFYLINKKEYQEAPVFSLYLITLTALFLSLL
jgi:4-hydroxybenzoate polyprenyltransferase